MINRKFNIDLFKHELNKIINDEAKYKAWIENLEFNIKADILQVIVENSLFKNKIKALFHSVFFLAAERLNYKLKNIDYHLSPASNQLKKIIYNRQPQQRELFFTDKIINKFEQKFEFDNFIIDDSNKVAYNSAISISRSIGNLFNPFILYGSNGSGKTHLVQSIAKYTKYVYPQINLKYFDAVFFKELYLNALKKNSLIEFRERFRRADIFVIENIEELEGCYSVQEEFFHIYNNLIQNNYQLIITSSIQPDKLSDFMPRLLNRFKTGVTLEMKQPSDALKIKFIKNKTTECELYFPDELIIYFLSKCPSANLKNIDMCVNKLIAYLSVTKKILNKEVIDEVFLRVASLPEAVTINEIQKYVSQYFNIQLDDIKSKCRTQDIVLPKHIAMYLSRELTDFSLQKISNDFGKVDKTTINHACSKIKNMIATNDNICNVVKDITRILFNKSENK